MMTAPKPMTRRELIELAALDALGLLDEYEALLYTRSFHHAPAAVQDEIVDLQAKIAADPALISDDEPSAELRERVLDYVNREVELSASDLKPLATIGRTRTADPVSTAALIDVHKPEIAGRIVRSTPLWRVAAFALCGAVIVMAYFLSDAINKQHTLAWLALANNTDARLEQMIGPTVKDYIFDRSSIRVVLSSPDAPAIGRAVLFMNEASNDALLVTELPRTFGDEYELVIRDAAGVVHHVAQFASDGGVSGMRIAVSSVALAAGSSWEITGPNGLMLTSA